MKRLNCRETQTTRDLCSTFSYDTVSSRQKGQQILIYTCSAGALLILRNKSDQNRYSVFDERVTNMQKKGTTTENHIPFSNCFSLWYSDIATHWPSVDSMSESMLFAIAVVFQEFRKELASLTKHSYESNVCSSSNLAAKLTDQTQDQFLCYLLCLHHLVILAEFLEVTCWNVSIASRIWNSFGLRFQYSHHCSTKDHVPCSIWKQSKRVVA